jgi:5-methylcytosine-specific restriction enzyme A
MALKVLKPKLTKLPTRLATSRAVRDKRYSPDATVRGWYHSTRWQKLRQQVLERDLYTCQQTGVLLIGKHPAPNSPVVDHITAHKGDEQLFWDISNLQAVSFEYHETVKKKLERTGNLA